LNPHRSLPERASLDYLKKLAKEHLRELRRSDPQAKLAAALHAIAREHGFLNWRELKAEVDRRNAVDITRFFEACASGDANALREMLRLDPTLVRAADPKAQHANWTGLHTAAQRGHLDAVQVLLQHGADPNAREAGDNTYPLHWAAARRNADILRALLDAGGDVHGFGDVHQLDTIGWATFFTEPGVDIDVTPLLVERGARHHIYSAICIGDLSLIQNLVEQNPDALDRRMSRFEGGLTALHFAIKRKRYDILDLLIELGADLEATDHRGHTALATATLHADREAMSPLLKAGAKPLPAVEPMDLKPNMSRLAESVHKGVPMIHVPDVAKTLDWYASIGFTELERFGDDGATNFGLVSFGKVEIMFNLGRQGQEREHDLSLWLYTDKIDDLYKVLRSQVAASVARVGSSQVEIEFEEDINEPFYGGRQFGIRDLNGYILYFMQPG
jgi:ankyrin repeat protein